MAEKTKKNIGRMREMLLETSEGLRKDDLILGVFAEEFKTYKKSKKDFLRAKHAAFYRYLKVLENEGTFESDEKNKRRKEIYKYKINPVKSLLAIGDDSTDFDGYEATLPFLEGMLEAYSDIPFVDNILTAIKAKIKKEEDSILSTRGFKNIDKSEELKVVLKIIDSIGKNQGITFDYSDVWSLKERKVTHSVFPLHILLFEGLYYLWAIKDPKSSQIERFRIDRIINFEIKATFEDSSFNQKRTKKRLKFEDVLEHTLGVVPPKQGQVPQTFRLKFYDWAANYVLASQIHETSSYPQINEKENSCTVEIEVYDTVEVSYLLGRFRDFCEILEPQGYKLHTRIDGKPI
jgi:predicted DNA-binding transcriptional regulator YafY